jgi:hypothetical protein
VYWEDAVHNHGAFDGRAWDFVEFAAPQVAKYFATTQHNISNINYDLRGSVAYTESYLLAFHRIAGDPATLNAVFGTEYATRQQEEADFHDYVLVGRYLDRFEKRGGRWRIAERTVVQDWNINQPGSAIFNDAIVNVIKRRSARDRTDLSYFREGEGE